MLFLMAVVLAFSSFMADAEAKKTPHRRSVKKQVTRQVVREQAAPTVRASGGGDSRYAAVILNPATGEIYHQQDANAKRYPASLTKMMTLYMLFEALERNKMDMDDRLRVSALAARQPQTNLSLQEGDRIGVETAIKALVVRSANDVSVVVGEAIGGDVETFARMMTSKARALGMKNTVFKNPNGLPNSGQYTTAMDMARLGIALKRDFPRYYRYFSTLQFSHNGVNYYTHNRVLLRYAGTDGIKTGYIGASGFNLVTSVVRGGRPLVGVVMGGQSGGWRDNRMIELLDESYEIVASRGATRGKRFPNNLPLPKAGGSKGAGIALAQAEEEEAPPTPSALAPKTVAQAVPEPTEAEDGWEAATLPPATLEKRPAMAEKPIKEPVAVAHAPEPVPPAVYTAPTAPVLHEPAVYVERPTPAAAVITPTPPIGGAKVIQLAPTAPIAEHPKPSPFEGVAPETMVVEPAPVQKAPVAPIQLAAPPSIVSNGEWGVQVGAFSSDALAQQAARNALNLAPKALVGARISIMGPAVSGVPVHRARLENLSQPQARKACETLISNNTPCFIFRGAAQ